MFERIGLAYIAREDDIGDARVPAVGPRLPGWDAGSHLAEHHGMPDMQRFRGNVAGSDAALGDEEGRGRIYLRGKGLQGV